MVVGDDDDVLAPLKDALEEGEVNVEEESAEDVPDLKHASNVHLQALSKPRDIV